MEKLTPESIGNKETSWWYPSGAGVVACVHSVGLSAIQALA